MTPLDLQKVFGALRAARVERRWVIPLVGSGISVDTGFPVASHLVDYLVRFAWWRAEENDITPASYLRANLWPSRHDLHIRWRTRYDLTKKKPADSPRDTFSDNLRKAEVELRNRAMIHELQRRSPTAASVLRGLLDVGEGNAGIVPWPNSMSQLVRNTPSHTDFRALLDYLCDGDGTLIDAFFDHFSRNRPPSTTHQHLAFVTRLLGCKLFLTTNFDPFAEQVMINEGMDPTVYEVTRGGTIPSARLLHRQRLSIVKLHGGAYSLRTGFDLDDPPPPAELAEYASYFRPPRDVPPLVLVMGYSGSDRRVMSILETHLHNNWGSEHDRSLRLLWISRDAFQEGSPVDSLAKSLGGIHRGRVQFCEYRDAGLFLHELFQNLEYQHPVTRSSYQILTHTPRAFAGQSRIKSDVITRRDDFLEVLDSPETGKFLEEMESRKAVVFLAEREGNGTSLHLARAARKMERTHITIWIDAAELRSRAAMFALIEESFHRYDRHLLRISRPLMYQDVDYISRTIRPDYRLLNCLYEWEEKVALRWISMAMRRGRYILAIDSLGEFTQGHQSLRKLDEGRNEQFDLGLRFVQKLLDGDTDLGESKVFVAVTNPDTEKLEIPSSKAEAQRGSVSDSNDSQRESPSLFFQSMLHQPRDPMVAYCQLESGAPLNRTRVDTAALRIQAALDEDKTRIQGFIVLLASFCRRPRSVASLIAVAIRASRQVLKRKLPVSDSVRKAMLAVAKLTKGETTTAEALGILCGFVNAVSEPRDASSEAPLLVRLEGGFYWLHRGVRKAAYELATNTHLNECVDEIFDCFANFAHADLHSRSKDAASFLEYFFFRLASIDTIKDGEEADQRRLARCNWLVAGLELERERLLSRGRLTALLNHIRTFLIWLEKSAPRTLDYVDLRLRVLSIYADIFLACGHPQEATAYRMVQASLLLSSDAARQTPWDTEEAPEFASLMCEVDCSEGSTVANLTTKIQERLSALEPMLTSENKTLSDMRKELSTYRSLTNLLTDIAVSLLEPIMFHEIPSQDFWDQYRRQRKELIDKVFVSAIECSKNLMIGFGQKIETRPVTHTEDVERWSRASMRYFEFRFNAAGKERFLGMKPIEAESALGTELRQIERACDLVNQELRGGPSSARRKRHKCYLSLMKARCQTLRGAEHDAGVNFHRALSSLARAAGAPERTAAGVVYLFQAESKLLQIHWLREEEKRHPGPTNGVEEISYEEKQARRKAINRAAILLDECESLLNQAKPAMSRDGRLENRWRVFLSFLKAKLKLYRFEQADHAPPNPELLFDALRHTVAALTNTGTRTDRRHVLVTLFENIKANVNELENDHRVEGGLWLKWKLQVGLRTEDDNIDAIVLRELKELKRRKTNDASPNDLMEKGVGNGM